MFELTKQQKKELKRYQEYDEGVKGHTICKMIEVTLEEWEAIESLYPEKTEEEQKEYALLYLTMKLFEVEQALKFFGVE